MFPISFAIITAGDADSRIEEIISSIEANAIPEYEILIVGGKTSTIVRRNTRHVAFDETQRMGWITRKKNLASAEASHEVMVVFHDYHVFDPTWYEAFVDFGLDWDVQINQILMINGVRMLDWLIYDHPSAPIYTPVPYHRTDLIQHQYVSGGYFAVKRTLMLVEPQNEDLLHNQAEDLDWSLRIRDRFKIRMNPAAIVRHNRSHRENAIQKERMSRLGNHFE